MAKPKHPNLRSVKQGQTIFYVANDSFQAGRPMPRYLESWYLHSHKVKLPPMGERIKQMPVSHMKTSIIKFGQGFMKDFYYSRKRALAEVARVNVELGFYAWEKVNRRQEVSDRSVLEKVKQ